jgi:alginate biosynthesis protein Alg44
VASLAHCGRSAAGYLGIGADYSRSGYRACSIEGHRTFVDAGDEVKAGEPLLTIQGTQGNSIVLDSPCNCVVQIRDSRTTNLVRVGAPIPTLREKTSNPYVTASIPPDEALRF